MNRRSILTCLLVAWAVVAGFGRGAAAQEGANLSRGAGQGQGADQRQTPTQSQAGDLAFALDTAELRETIDLPSFPDPFVPVNGQYLIVWLTVVNNGAASVDYDVCPPEDACFDPSWFEVVDGEGAAFPVDELARAAVDSSEERVLNFGNEIEAGGGARIVLAFDVPAGAASWVLRGTDVAPAPFSLPIATSERATAPEATPLLAEMNQTVPLGGVEIVATRAEQRATIDVPTQPAPFVPVEGEYVAVYLSVTNTGSATGGAGGAAEYDICPPGGPLCLNQLWFELADAAGSAYPVEPVAWAAFSLDKPDLLPFGSELAPGTPEPIALVFDVPAGVTDWSLNSTAEAPRPFSIRLQLSAAPGSIQVVRGAAGGEGSGPGAAVELILDTSGSMLESLEGRRRIDVAKEVLGELVAETLPPGTPIAMRVFGSEPDSCETNLLVGLHPLEPVAAADTIAGLEAIDGVNTPIGASLEQVAADLADAPGPKIVVLVTDGEETCGGDPAATLRTLAQQGIDVRVNIVGFAVEDEAIKAQFREWAHLGNGQYFDAAGAADLGQAVAAAVQPPFRVLDAAGNDVAGGLVGGAPIELPPGTYAVEVRSAVPTTIGAVVVDSGARVEVAWDER